MLSELHARLGGELRVRRAHVVEDPAEGREVERLVELRHLRLLEKVAGRVRHRPARHDHDATNHLRPALADLFAKLGARHAGHREIAENQVVLAARGQKIGAAILTELESRAMAIGARRFVLDTGPRQPESLRRFERAGYVRCAPWGEFVGKDLSICMTKTVADGDRTLVSS